MTTSSGRRNGPQHSRTKAQRAAIRIATAGLFLVTVGPAAGRDEPGNVPALSPADTPLARVNPATSSESCLICHNFDPTLSHPVGVLPPPSMAIPADLPLERGVISCLTCHTGIPAEHAEGLNRGSAARTTGHADASLCVRCHDATGSSTPEMHAAALGQAHLTGSQQGWAVRNSSSLASTSTASDSNSCLTCHDGAMASDATARTGAVLIGLPDEGPQAHPVSVEYRMESLRPGEGGLRPESMLDPRIRLFDHRVECASCHSPYSSEPRLLVMSNEGSRLCLTCHDL